MRPRLLGVPTLYLKPGQMHISLEPLLVLSVLGSCVAVTLFHPLLKVGAICHAVMPQCKNGQACGGSCEGMFKYVNCAIPRMIECFDQVGASLNDLEVKLFGGSDMFENNLAVRNTTHIGRENVHEAERIIASRGLRVTASDVGGNYGRKIIFHTHTGEVLLKRLK